MSELNRPFFSIVVAVYNTEKYLTACMDSIINQSFTDIEIITVNDCSTDNSPEILKYYEAEDKRVKIIDKKQNEGILAARLSGTRAANGEYVIFVDSDDCLEKDTCRYFWNSLNDNPVDILQGNTRVINYTDNTGAVETLEEIHRAVPVNENQTQEYLLYSAFTSRKVSTNLWGKAYRLDICKEVCEVLPEDKINIGEDVLIFLHFVCMPNHLILFLNMSIFIIMVWA